MTPTITASSRIASRVRLGELSSRPGDADWLDGAFSAGDLLMVTVLRRLSGSGILDEPLWLCRPWRSAARLQACFRRSIVGFHQQGTDRLTNVRRGCLRAECREAAGH
jgi:hypothetical protein